LENYGLKIVGFLTQLEKTASFLAKWNGDQESQSVYVAAGDS